MDQLEERLIEFVSQQDNPLGIAVLCLSAFIEYVFPPFPGDTVTLFGAFLITSHGWGFVPVYLAVVAGSAAGAMVDFWFGTWLKRKELSRPGIDRLVERFQRHGEAYIVLNRFLPGVRALFFVAAGMARMRARWVLLWATVSAAIWNLMLIAIGSSVGANFDELERVFRLYSRWMWIALGGIVSIWVARVIWRRVTSRSRGGGAPG